jgi:hypothetical protein
LTPHDRSPVCVRCAREFTPATYWQRFCGEECRRAFHAEETKRGRELARRERASADIPSLAADGGAEAA